MPRPLSYLGLGSVSLAGILLGVQLGYAAVGEINPVYFRSAEPRLTYADLSGYRSPSWAPDQTSPAPLYAEPSPPDYPEDSHDYLPIDGPEPAMDGRAASAPEPIRYRPAQLVLADVPTEPGPDTADVERYAAMPVQAPAIEQAVLEVPATLPQ